MKVFTNFCRFYEKSLVRLQKSFPNPLESIFTGFQSHKILCEEFCNKSQPQRLLKTVNMRNLRFLGTSFDRNAKSLITLYLEKTRQN